MFSPLGHNDKIWTINTTRPHELDLITGEWSPLSIKFGNVFKRQVREDGIWKDEHSGETYISCFHDGLIRYYPDIDTFEFLRIHPVTAFYPRKKNIVLGTANGLYFLNRNDNNLTVAGNFPLDIWVNSIHELNNDTLIVNYKYYYHITTTAFGEKNISKPKSEERANYNYISREVKSKLPTLSGGFREFNSDSISWYYREGELFFSKNKNIFYTFPEFPEGYVRHMLEDTDYLYTLFNNQFVIFNKEYIFEKSIIHEVSNYQELRKELLQKRDDLYQSEIPFDKYLASSIALYKDEKYSGYSDLNNILQNIPKSFEYYSYKQGVENLNSILENDTIPEMFKYSIIKGICRKYTTSAKLDSALIYFNLITELYPSNKDECIDYSFPCITKTHSFLDSLRNENVPTDKFMFFEAKAKENMIHCSCWFGDSYYNYSIVEERYQELLTTHPNSEYADDAEFWLINYQNYGDEEGGYPLNEIPRIRQFTSKYPNSNLIPELLMNIAYSYSIEYSENIEQRIKNIDKGIKELKGLKINYQLDSIELVNVEKTLKQFEHQENELTYNIAIVPLKSDYKMNEEIEIEVTLSNNSSIPKTLKLFQNDSYVSFGIHPNKKAKFIPIAESDSIMKDFIILRDEPLKQNIKLNKLARHWDGGKLGRFSFEEEGLYYLTCFSRKNNLSSKQVKIYIKK